MPGTVYTLKLQVQPDTIGAEKAARSMQRAMSSAFGGGGQGGLASDPTGTIQRILGLPVTATRGGKPWFTGAPPPQIPTPPVIQSAMKGIDWKQFALGLATAPFSPYMGARALSGSGAFGSGGGGNGGILGALSGAGGFQGLLKAFVAIELAARAFRFALEEMTAAVQRGAQLYLKAAELGTSAFTTSRLQKTAALLGMPESALTNLVASGQFMRGQKVTGQDVNSIILGSGRGILGKEELQGLLNLSNEVAMAWNRISGDAQASAQVAHELFTVNMNFAELKSAWQSLWEQGVTLIEVSTNLNDVIALVTEGVRELTMSFMGWNWVLQKLGLEAKDSSADFSRKVPGAAVGRPESAWEKMGLIIAGGIGGSDYARQTAQNTKRIADALDQKDLTPVNYGMPSMMPFSLP